jgi:hypothetical protein
MIMKLLMFHKKTALCFKYTEIEGKMQEEKRYHA